MMIPYLQQPTLTIGPVTLAAFGVIVATAVLVGLTIGRRRFASLGLDDAFGEHFVWWTVLGGFVGAHVFSVVFYFPEKVAEDPLVLLKLWEDISSFGGMIGGALAIWLFLQRRSAELTPAMKWASVDVAAFVLPIALAIGRLACAIAHDHPGTITRFPLAVSLARPEAREFIAGVYVAAGRAGELPPASLLGQLGFHDLGWYEFLYLVLVVVPLILLLERRQRHRRLHRHGSFLLTFIALYMPVRFLLDFLRVSDVHYAGLTPAQWAALGALAALPILWRRTRATTSLPSGKRLTFWTATLFVLVLDIVTKYVAHTRLFEHQVLQVIGDWLRLTRLYNPGAAFGLSLGPYSRWLFTALTIGALVVLANLYRATAPGGRTRALAIGLVTGGALGNLVNRLWQSRGVVDWIDVGIGEHRWPSFNVADIGVSVGAVLLVLVLWREDRASEDGS